MPGANLETTWLFAMLPFYVCFSGLLNLLPHLPTARIWPSAWPPSSSGSSRTLLSLLFPAPKCSVLGQRQLAQRHNAAHLHTSPPILAAPRRVRPIMHSVNFLPPNPTNTKPASSCELHASPCSQTRPAYVCAFRFGLFRPFQSPPLTFALFSRTLFSPSALFSVLFSAHLTWPLLAPARGISLL
jgi:hypothetical protein